MSLLSGYNTFPVKKSKASRACDVCRKRKVKCDGAIPACSTCVEFGYECTFKYKPKKRGPNPLSGTSLESRLGRLEKLMLPLIEENRSKKLEKTRLSPESMMISQEEEDVEEEDEEESEEDSSLSKLSQCLSDLALDGKHYFRYLGSSSGLYVLEGGKLNKDGLLKELIYHFDNYGSVSWALSNNFPLQELTKRLLPIYFDRHHRYVPIFNRADLEDRINSEKEVSLALLNSIYAVACLHIQMDEIYEDPEIHVSVTNHFFAQAKAYLDKEYLTPSVQTVQALILMAFQPEGSWTFLGMAIRIGQELGLHRNLDLDKMDLVQKQNRQLAWWGCFFLDRLLSSILGRPMCINEKDCDVKLPVDICSMGSNKTTIEDEFAESIRYFNQVICLYTLLTQTLRTIYGVTKKSKSKARDTLLHLNKSLSDWNTTLRPEFWYDITLSRPNSHYAAMLALQYHYIVILTNRPYIAPSGDSTSPFNNLALQACAKSASIISYILYHIHEPYLLHEIQGKSTFIFCASTIHTMNITSSDSNLAYASKANLIVNLNILKNINIHSAILYRNVIFIEDMIQSHGLSDMVSDSQQPVIYSSSKEQLPTSGYLTSPPSRHDSESLFLQSHKTSINVPSATPNDSPNIKSTSSPSVLSYPATSTDRDELTEPKVVDTGKSRPLTDINTLSLTVNSAATLGGEDNENADDFDLELWNVFISMFNQTPENNGGK
ncbi:hypothetical protein K7432_011756 [Basidiobolus ranarum]|uniref:Zn(2)-C6 fungal-type domain-containing protein n=1 Tax=Basidiobolus ranarum TaxID=34480 RepID=A0ABR2VTF9_9FUNG